MNNNITARIHCEELKSFEEMLGNKHLDLIRSACLNTSAFRT